MLKIFNKIFSILKYLMLIASFILTVYIMLFMYRRLDKNPFGDAFLEFMGVVLPFILNLVLFTINVAGGQKSVTDKVFFNISCVIAFSAMILIGYRALVDENMVLWGKYNYKINFNYFADQLTQIKFMLYLIFAGDIFLIIAGKLNKKKELPI